MPCHRAWRHQCPTNGRFTRVSYKGTGNAHAPYAEPVKAGWGYHTYRLMF
ncbi:hypothetical protein ACFXO2_13025 [Streptomyces sp. NPDC059152]